MPLPVAASVGHTVHPGGLSPRQNIRHDFAPYSERYRGHGLARDLVIYPACLPHAWHITKPLCIQSRPCEVWIILFPT